MISQKPYQFTAHACLVSILSFGMGCGGQGTTQRRDSKPDGSFRAAQDDQTQQNQWQEFEEPGNTFRAEFPGPPRRERKGQLALFHVTDSSDVDYAVSVRTDTRLGQANLDVPKFVDALAAGIASQKHYRVVKQQRLTIEGFPAKETVVRDKRIGCVDVYRTVLVEPRVFLLWVNGRASADHADTKRFFASFVPIPDPLRNVTSAFMNEPAHQAPRQKYPPEPADIVETLTSGDGSQISRMLKTLRQIKPGARRVEIARLIEAQLSSDNSFTRRDAMRALETWSGKENIPALMRALDDDNFVVRHVAIKTLANFPERRCAEAIARVYPFNSLQARDALKRMGSVAEPFVVEMLSHPNWPVRNDACNILSRMGTSESLDKLDEVANDDDIGLVRTSARKAADTIRRQTQE